jgi:hypothetical protein
MRFLAEGQDFIFLNNEQNSGQNGPKTENDDLLNHKNGEYPGVLIHLK